MEKTEKQKMRFIIANMKSLKILVHSAMAYLCTILIIDKAFDVIAQRICKTHQKTTPESNFFLTRIDNPPHNDFSYN